MKCPITYETCEDKYSASGLGLLARNLKHLRDFPLTAKEQIEEAMHLAEKLSIQGIQPKLSIRLFPAEETFKIVDKGGTYILKPPHQIYEELPENEDLTMKMAAAVGLNVPLHGLIYNIDGSFSYFIKRFDRLPGGKKVAVEDFSQALGYSRETKYESSLEKALSVIDKFCSFPAVEKVKFFRLVIFNFLVGNEDMHLKNYSLIRNKDKVELSPCYDLLNSTIVLKTQEESALPIRGKKSNLKYADLVEYFGQERLGLPSAIINKELTTFQQAFQNWDKLIEQSFLSLKMRKSYRELVLQRLERINYGTGS